MKRKIYVHIGTHKTATTSIQAFLRETANSLKDCGIYIPHSGTINSRSGHHSIAWQIRGDSRYNPKSSSMENLMDEIDEISEIPHIHTLVISSEDFEYLSQYPQNLIKFDQAIEAAGYSTQYIVFFRNRENYINSLYQELLKHRIDCTYNQFKKSINTYGSFRCFDGWYFEFNYQRFVDQWESIVGKKLIVYDFDKVVNEEGILPFFMKIIGASDQIVEESKKVNQLRRLNTRQSTNWISSLVNETIKPTIRRTSLWKFYQNYRKNQN